MAKISDYDWTESDSYPDLTMKLIWCCLDHLLGSSLTYFKELLWGRIMHDFPSFLVKCWGSVINRKTSICSKENPRIVESHGQDILSCSLQECVILLWINNKAMLSHMFHMSSQSSLHFFPFLSTYLALLFFKWICFLHSYHHDHLPADIL